MKTAETYSRGLELLRDIWRAWALNQKERGVNQNKFINARMAAVKEKHDLTWDEYWYWTKLASEKLPKEHLYSINTTNPAKDGDGEQQCATGPGD